MDIIYLTILFLCFGFLFALLSSALSSLSIEDIDKKFVNKNHKLVSKTYFINNEFPDSSLILENFFYILSAIFYGIWSKIVFEWFGIIPAVIIFFAVIFIFRTLISSLGNKYNNNEMVLFGSLFVLLCNIYYPVIKIISLWELKIKGQSQEEVSRDEISALVESAMEEGSIEVEEYRILKNVMKFSEVLVSDVMTPRTVTFNCEANKSVGEVINLSEIQMYSRFPIWEGESMDDRIVGYVMTKDILNFAIKNKMDVKIREFVRELSFIPENATLVDALEQFLRKRQHIFLVVDEYGGIDGLITMEDVMENILGYEIVDEADRVIDMRELAKQRRDRRIQSRI